MESDPPDPKADLLWEYVDRINAGEPLDEEKIRGDHPDVADELIDQLKAFTRIEGGDPDADGDTGGDGESILGVLGDYRLLRQVGRGGMGVVYEARQLSLERRVALKVLPAGLLADTRAIARFVREAKVAASLQHPNVVSVFGLEIQANTPFFAMEMVDGETLAQRLTRLRTGGGGIAKADARYSSDMALAFAGAADGLQHAHQNHVVHRDLKPSNLILDRDGRLRILDFGLARLEGQESITVSGDFIGTPAYMSPEQARAKQVAIDHRTDIYSLGASLYEALTLRPPFRGRDAQDTISQIITRDPEPPRKVNPRIPKDLETIVLKCLRKEAWERYGTAEAMGQDLRRFARGDAVEARAEARWERMVRMVWRTRLRVGVGLLVGLLIVTTGIIVHQLNDRLDSQREKQYSAIVRGALQKVQSQRLRELTGAGRVAAQFQEITARGGVVIAAEGLEFREELTVVTEELDTAKSLFPDRPDAGYYRARCLLALGRDQEAIGEINQLCATCPNFIPALTLRSRVLARLGYRDQAKKAREHVQHIITDPWAEAWQRAEDGALAGDWKNTVAAYNDLLAIEEVRGSTFIGSQLDLRLGRGVARIEAGDLSGAVRDFLLADREWPEVVVAGLLVGLSYFEMDDEESAEHWFHELHQRSPQKDEVALGTAEIYRRRNRSVWAFDWLDVAGPSPARERLRMRCLMACYTAAPN